MPGAVEVSDDAAASVLKEQDDDLGRFHKADEVVGLIRRILPPENAASFEDGRRDDQQTVNKLLVQVKDILDAYLEQPYLLDPFMAQMLARPLARLQNAVRRQNDSEPPSAATDEALHRSAKLVYMLTKVRGHKAIMSYFPHEVADVVSTVAALQYYTRLGSVGGGGIAYDLTTGWELRYILLLWLSLVCMIPFDLDKFRSGSNGPRIADSIVEITQHFLDSPSKERDVAALTLGKVLQRRDLLDIHLPRFISWSLESISPRAEPSAFLVVGILQTLCELYKSGTSSAILSFLPRIQTILSMGDHDTADSECLRRLRTNSLVNKFRCKLACRLGLTLLGPRSNGRGVVRKALAGPDGDGDTQQNRILLDDDQVPEEIDAFIAQLLSCLEDRDTIVRYSAAKGLARICERLPASFVDQVADAITRLFEINVLRVGRDGMDLSAVSEHTWQGACLGLAELGRRGQLSPDELEDKLQWVRRALFLDVRKGSHSTGASVRDAACYVLWSLSRAYTADSILPHCLPLAQGLVTVALLDRDVSIRRAASAAFQENVGRLGIFPKGIDVVGKTDFFAVGVRRKAYLECLPAVAVHIEYRMFILEHLLNTTVCHWDSALRVLGSQATAKVVALDVTDLAPHVARVMDEKSSTSRDTLVLHGALLTMAEVGRVCDRVGSTVATLTRSSIFASLDKVPRHVLKSSSTGQVLEAACKLIASSASVRSLESVSKHDAQMATWEQFIDAALGRKEESIHEAAAEALRVVSSLANCDDRVQDNIHRWNTFSRDKQQGLALAMGSIGHTSPDAFVAKVSFLISLISSNSSRYSDRIEIRRNAIISLVSSIRAVSARDLPSHLPSDLSRQVFVACSNSLKDYTTDQRGDVGSWVRLATIKGIRDLIVHFRESAFPEAAIRQKWLPTQLFHDILGGLAKQMVERMDHVRAEAGVHLLQLYAGDLTIRGDWLQPLQTDLVRMQFDAIWPKASQENAQGEEELRRKVADATYTFPRATCFLLIPEYRAQVLQGLTQAIATRTELSHRVAASALVEFASTNHEKYGSHALLNDLLAKAEQNWAKSSTTVPILQSLDVLLQDEEVCALLEKPSLGDEAALADVLTQAIELCSKSISKVKAPLRLSVTLKLASTALRAGMIATTPTKSIIKASLRAIRLVTSEFLCHDYPTIRTQAAEHLYMILSEAIDVNGEEAEGGDKQLAKDMAEKLLLSTPWSDGLEGGFQADRSSRRERAEKIRQSFESIFTL